MPRKSALIITLAVSASLIGTADAVANAGGGFTWSFQTTSLTNSNSNAQVAVMMRNGLAWPVVVTDSFGQSGYGTSATLFPTTSTSPTGGPSSNWQNVGSGFFPTSSIYNLHSASSPDGRVAFAAVDSFSSPGNGLGGRVSSVSGGWGSLPAGTRAVAFDKSGTLYTATSTSVSGVGGYSGNSIIDIAVSPFGDVGVLSHDMKFWQYSNWLGGWTSSTLDPAFTSGEAMDVEFDSLGRPHVLANKSGALIAYDFNTVSGNWTSTTLVPNNFFTNSRAALAANNDGTVGTAWIDTAGQVIYAYKHDLDNWATAVVTNYGSPTGPSGGQVGITYDYADLPVLAYRSYPNNSIVVAYDPIVVPEPAGLALVAIAACTLTSRRRRTA